MESNYDRIEMRMSVIRKLIMIHKKFIQMAVNAFGNENLSRTEVIILFMLRKRKYKATDLAAEIGIPTSTLTGIIDRLIGKGYVARERSSEDRRVVMLGIGDNIVEKLDHVRESIGKFVSETEDRLSDKWWEDMGIELERLEQAIDSSQDLSE